MGNSVKMHAIGILVCRDWSIGSVRGHSTMFYSASMRYLLRGFRYSKCDEVPVAVTNITE